MSKNLLSDGSAYSKGVKAGYKIDANNVGMRALFNKLKAHDLGRSPELLCSIRNLSDQATSGRQKS
jgi:hypothetical protein